MRPLRPILCCLAAGLLCAPAAGATEAVPVTGAPLLTIVGPGDGSGFADHVDVVGDLDGDGRDDVVVTDPDHESYPETARGGTAWVVYGPDEPTRIDLRELRIPEQGFRVRGWEQDGRAGSAVADAGDVDGDGFDDLIVGVDRQDGPYKENTGRDAGLAAVVYGARVNRDVQLELEDVFQPSDGFVIDGPLEYARFGASVAGAGDVNGDGFDDVIVGAPGLDTTGRDEGGGSFVIYGSDVERRRVSTKAIAAKDGFRIRGAGRWSYEGSAVAGLGDLDGDGFDDVATGAPTTSVGDRTYAGVVTVVHGAAVNPEVDAATPEPGRTAQIVGSVTDDRVGGADALAAGDTDGDGRDDLVLGTPYRTTAGRAHAGAVTVVPGARLVPGATVDLATATGLTVASGPAPDAGAGRAVSVVDDLDGDGRAEWLAAADDTVTDAGTGVYLLHGDAGAAPDLAALLPADGLRLGGTAGDGFGSGLGGGGDLDGDGRGDLLIGAGRATLEPDREERGAAYAISGDLLPRAVFADPVRARAGTAGAVAARRWVAVGARTVAVTPALPAGLALDPATGTVSGTATAPGVTTHTVVLHDTRGTTRAPLRVVVAAPGSGGGTGPAGDPGSAGAAGQDGAQGAPGAAGPNGATGATGPAGASGATGRPGPAGADATAPAATPGTGLPRVRCTRVRAVARCAVRPPRGGTFSPVALVLRAGGRTVATATASRAGTVTLRGRVRRGRYELRLRLVADAAARDSRTIRL